ncbi:MAG: recombinase family protein [bacterium]|nr:recombinase family protein [bacterium]
MRDITHQLNLKCYAPHLTIVERTGHKPAWIPGTIKNLLQNSKYIGDWSFNKAGWVTNPETGQRKRVMKDKSEWQQNLQPHLAIVDSTTWSAAQARIQAGKRRDSVRRPAHRSSFLFLE